MQKKCGQTFCNGKKLHFYFDLHDYQTAKFEYFEIGIDDKINKKRKNT